MKSYSKLLWIVCLPLLLVSLSGCLKTDAKDKDVLEQVDSKQEINWGVKNDTKLFGLMNIETREVEGFDIDIAKEITKRMLGDEGQANFIEVTSKTRIPLLKNGNIDAIIATMTISDERKKQVDFSDVYFDAGQSLLVPKNSDIKEVSDLGSSHTVLAVKGSTSAENIKVHAKEAEILELENYAEAFTALQSGQGDAMTTDNSILMGMSEENPNFVLAGDNFTDEPYGIAIDKNQDAFKTKVNQALEEMKSDGTYADIYKKWFNDEPK